MLDYCNCVSFDALLSRLTCAVALASISNQHDIYSALTIHVLHKVHSCSNISGIFMEVNNSRNYVRICFLKTNPPMQIDSIFGDNVNILKWEPYICRIAVSSRIFFWSAWKSRHDWLIKKLILKELEKHHYSCKYDT